MGFENCPCSLLCRLAFTTAWTTVSAMIGTSAPNKWKNCHSWQIHYKYRVSHYILNNKQLKGVFWCLLWCIKYFTSAQCEEYSPILNQSRITGRTFLFMLLYHNSTEKTKFSSRSELSMHCLPYLKDIFLSSVKYSQLCSIKICTDNNDTASE